MNDKDMKPENMTVMEAFEYYEEKIKKGEPSDDDSFINKILKNVYHLGDGNFEKGWERLRKREEEHHERELRDDPILAFFEQLLKSENPVHRMVVKFIGQGGMSLPIKDGRVLQEKLLREENYESAKQLPISVDIAISEKKQKGRYRLTPDEIKARKEVVKKANLIFNEANPKKTWKEIANDLGIPERTLRGWRHNPIFSDGGKKRQKMA